MAGRPRQYRVPFEYTDWQSFRDSLKAMEETMQALATVAEASFGTNACDRGMRLKRDMQTYREHVGGLAFNGMDDPNQYKLTWD